MNTKQVTLYATLFGAAFVAGTYKGYALSQGQVTPALDATLLAAPLAAGLVTASAVPKYRGTGWGIGEGIEAMVHGGAGVAGTTAAELVGTGLGYIIGKY